MTAQHACLVCLTDSFLVTVEAHLGGKSLIVCAALELLVLVLFKHIKFHVNAVFALSSDQVMRCLTVVKLLAPGRSFGLAHRFSHGDRETRRLVLLSLRVA